MSIDNVQDITPRKQYVASGGQTVFPYDFPIFADGDLVVDVDGVILTITTDYTVSGAGDDNGGNVTLTSGATAGEIVTIYRDIPIERDTDFQQNGPWRSASINDELDRMTLVDQQLKLATTRALRVAVNDAADFADLEIPAASSRASKFLAFDANGNPTVSNGTGADTGLREDIASGAAGAVTYVDTVADMKALTGLVDNALIEPLGSASVSDGVAGRYRYDASDLVTASDPPLVHVMDDGKRAKLLPEILLGRFGAAPVFDEASSALSRRILFDEPNTVVISGTNKNLNYIGIRDGADENVYEITSGSLVAGLAYYMNSNASSHANSNLYAVIGNLSNSGPGTVKALYGRAQAKSGCTGTVMAGVFRVELDTGSTATDKVALQIGHAGNVAIAMSAIIQIDTEAASAQSAYGILSLNTMTYTTAFIRAVAGGGGDFLRWQASGGGAALFSVLDDGSIVLAPAAANSKMLDLTNGARVNFTATAGSATAGASGAPPAQVNQYIKVLVGGAEQLIPCYNP